MKDATLSVYGEIYSHGFPKRVYLNSGTLDEKGVLLGIEAKGLDLTTPTMLAIIDRVALTGPLFRFAAGPFIIDNEALTLCQHENFSLWLWPISWQKLVIEEVKAEAVFLTPSFKVIRHKLTVDLEKGV